MFLGGNPVVSVSDTSQMHGCRKPMRQHAAAHTAEAGAPQHHCRNIKGRHARTDRSRQAQTMAIGPHGVVIHALQLPAPSCMQVHQPGTEQGGKLHSSRIWALPVITTA